MEKSEYKIIKDIRERLKSGEATSFKERNILNIYDKRMKKKLKNELRK